MILNGWVPKISTVTSTPRAAEMFLRAAAERSSRPKGLKGRSIKALAEYIRSGSVKNVVFLTGAGVSVSAGIPDFRSPGGMYDTLRPELLTATTRERAAMRADPTAVVSWDIFRGNPFPYLELRRPFILGVAKQQWKPTLAHWFTRVCHDRGLLRRLYTQNIDGLDYGLELPAEKIVPVHGSLGVASCEFCGAEYPQKAFRSEVASKIKDIYKMDAKAPSESSPIACPKCKRAGVKPSTVLYGRNLPKAFFDSSKQDFPDETDILFVAGTSLTVGPANSLPSLVRSDCVRVVVNREAVGDDLGIRYEADAERDIFGQGDCDAVFLDLAEDLGWLPDLVKHVEHMADKSAKLLMDRMKKNEKNRQGDGKTSTNSSSTS